MTEVLVAVGVMFLLIGITTAIVMGRLGHDPWSWGVLGALFGPLVVALAVHAYLSHPQSNEVLLEPARDGIGLGGVDVLVGVDGSAESVRATEAAIAMLGDRIRSLTLATVVDFEAQEAIEDRKFGTAFADEAKALLDDAGAWLGDRNVNKVVLSGRPADALVAYARQHGSDLIVIGARGHGMSERLLGSVAEQLVREPNVLVLVAGASVPSLSQRAFR